jgi:hypothetical protein
MTCVSILSTGKHITVPSRNYDLWRKNSSLNGSIRPSHWRRCSRKSTQHSQSRAALVSDIPNAKPTSINARPPDRHEHFHQRGCNGFSPGQPHMPSLSIHPTLDSLQWEVHGQSPAFQQRHGTNQPEFRALLQAQTNLGWSQLFQGRLAAHWADYKKSTKSGGAETGSPLLYWPTLGPESDLPPMERYAHTMGSTKCRSPRNHNIRKPC